MNSVYRIIADIGSNWRVGSLKESRKRASNLIESAVANGAHVVKFQLIEADQLYRDPDQAAQLKKYELPAGWVNELKTEIESRGSVALFTPFHLGAVDLLESIGIAEYKIASWDLTYTPLLEKIAKTKKPVILSTGAATIDEVQTAVDVLRPEDGELGLDNLTLMHCTGGYPTPIQDLNLRRILDLAENFFPLDVGFSAHTTIPALVAAAVMFRAETFEVHFDLDDGKGVEAGHSYTPESLHQLVNLIAAYNEAMECSCTETFSDFDGRVNYRRDPSDWLRPPLNPLPLQ